MSKIQPVVTRLLLLLLFLTFSPLVANPKKTTLHRGQTRSRSAEQGKKKSGSAPPPPPTLLVRRKSKSKSRDASTCLGATQVGVTQVSVRLGSVQGFLRFVGQVNGYRFAKFYASVCDSNFPSLVASLFSWRCLAASSSSFLHAAMNLRLEKHHSEGKNVRRTPHSKRKRQWYKKYSEKATSPN